MFTIMHQIFIKINQAIKITYPRILIWKIHSINNKIIKIHKKKIRKKYLHDLFILKFIKNYIKIKIKYFIIFITNI